VFPNPANESIKVLFKGELKGKQKKIKIFSTLGKVIFETNMHEEFFSTPLSDQPNGYYYLYVETDIGYSCGSFIVLH
jgi:hypothetical protein